MKASRTSADRHVRLAPDQTRSAGGGKTWHESQWLRAERGAWRGDLEGLKAAGYNVAASYPGNDEAAAKFKAETGIAVYKWDVADSDACAAGVKQVETDLGPVDMLVNNAGITRDGIFHKMTSINGRR